MQDAMQALLVSTGVVALAEIGDKTQLLASSWVLSPISASATTPVETSSACIASCMTDPQTLKRKCITSPSRTRYSLPSSRSFPASLAPCSPLSAM